jgi:hypothetical protein
MRQQTTLGGADHIVRKSVIDWFEKVVLGLNLCPFAHRPFRDQRIRFEVSNADDESQCLADLYLQLNALDNNPDIETIIMIVPRCAGHFDRYLALLDLADALLVQEGWEGIYQIASFHPDYQFAGTPRDARENWTNRSPFPLLHLLRERSIELAVAQMPVGEAIVQRNISKMDGLSGAEMRALFGPRFTEN